MAMNIIGSLRRGLDRAGFETDRLMRYNRVKAEAARLGEQIKSQTLLLGERVLELHGSGAISDARVAELASQIAELRRLVRAKEEEAAAIQAEAWPEPEPGAPAAAGPQPPGGAKSSGQAQPAVSYCPRCGAGLRPMSAFCSRCGERL